MLALLAFCLPVASQSNCLYVLLQPQQQQVEEERSLNSLDDGIGPAFPLLGPLSRSRVSPLDQDRQLLEDILSFYLTAPSSSSSSSATSSSTSSLSSPSSFFSDLDFPLDYDDNYVSQVARLKEQQQQREEEEKKKKEEAEEKQQKFDTFSALDGESMEGKSLISLVNPSFAI